MYRLLLIFTLLACTVFPQRLSRVTFGGSGNDVVAASASDEAGNTWITGVTGSFDLPVVNAWQAANRGTRYVVSTDSGATWSPLAGAGIESGLVSGVLVVDAANPAVFFTAIGNRIYRTEDGGQSFTSTAVPVSGGATLSALAIDPTNSKVLYAGVSYGPAILKSVNGGNTWTPSFAGIPDQAIVSSIAVDPFQPQKIWVWIGRGGYVSTDGGATWSISSMPWGGANVSGGGVGFQVDPVTPGVVYGPAIGADGMPGVQRSRDGGQTWATLPTPFSGTIVTLDPVRPGYLYAVTTPRTKDVPAFFRSRDFGATWEQKPFPSQYPPEMRMTVDPSNPDILLAGMLRSTDGGNTWQRNRASRQMVTQFSRAQKGRVYGVGTPTHDAFVAKYGADGKTLRWATYFGGMGSEGAVAIAVDAAGSSWIVGTTTSADLPVTADAFQQSLNGDSDIFVARFDADGVLRYCTYLGGELTESASAIAVGADGSAWLTGATISTAFPGMSGTLPVYRTFVAKLDAGGSLVLAKNIGGNNQEAPGGITIDGSGNVLVTGATYSADFPVTAGAVTGTARASTLARVFLVKLDSSGSVVFSTAFGGAQAARAANGPGGLRQSGNAITVDGGGNILIAGNTSATDFPVTAGAAQTINSSGCPWPAFTVYTGTIGTIVDFMDDDAFVTKVSADGTSILWSTFVGGRCYDRATSVALDASGNVVVAGETNSDNFPVTRSFESAPPAAQYKSFVTMLDGEGSRIGFSSYLTAGSHPVVTAAPEGRLRLAGSQGVGAQTIQNSGGIFGAFEVPAADAALFTLDLAAPPAEVQLTSAVNAFSLLGGNIAPGEIVVLTVAGLPADVSFDVGLAGGSQISTKMGGVEVLFNGTPGLVMSAGAGRIYAIAPVRMTGATAGVVVRVNGQESNELSVSLGASAPGLLSADGSGKGYAQAMNQDGTVNSASNPAAYGSAVTVFVTGLDLWSGTSGPMLGLVPATPLAGFVPGIYAIRLTLPASAANYSPAVVVVDDRQILNLYVR